MGIQTVFANHAPHPRIISSKSEPINRKKSKFGEVTYILLSLRLWFHYFITNVQLGKFGLLGCSLNIIIRLFRTRPTLFAP